MKSTKTTKTAQGPTLIPFESPSYLARRIKHIAACEGLSEQQVIAAACIAYDDLWQRGREKFEVELPEGLLARVEAEAKKAGQTAAEFIELHIGAAAAKLPA